MQNLGYSLRKFMIAPWPVGHGWWSPYTTVTTTTSQSNSLVVDSVDQQSLEPPYRCGADLFYRVRNKQHGFIENGRPVPTALLGP